MRNHLHLLSLQGKIKFMMETWFTQKKPDITYENLSVLELGRGSTSVPFHEFILIQLVVTHKARFKVLEILKFYSRLLRMKNYVFL